MLYCSGKRCALTVLLIWGKRSTAIHAVVLPSRVFANISKQNMTYIATKPATCFLLAQTKSDTAKKHRHRQNCETNYRRNDKKTSNVSIALKQGRHVNGRQIGIRPQSGRQRRPAPGTCHGAKVN